MRTNATTGYEFEYEFGGIASNEVSVRLRARRVRGIREGLQKVKGWQRRLGWNPRRPPTPLARCLFQRVASRLRHGSIELRLYNALGTIVDRMGIDFFFEYNHRIVTLDLTINGQKKKARFARRYSHNTRRFREK